jgi:hypothetical protein
VRDAVRHDDNLHLSEPTSVRIGRWLEWRLRSQQSDALHRKLKVRAANSGRTLSDYLLAELDRRAARPTREEILTRIHSRKRVTLKTPAAVVIREERESA